MDPSRLGRNGTIIVPMRFTVIGHACLFIETGAERVLVDPWLSGSCYWRSWWHFPPNAELRPEFFEPDYLYLSHHHFDHFHYPSLRRISKKARVLIPRFGVDVMRHELDQLGFKDVTELPHAAPLTMASGTRIGSYQYGPDDSACVVERDGVVLADLNDCKIKGRAASPILKAFGPPTFIFKSHSFAQAYPNCYDIADPADAQLMTREDFLETFIDAIRELQPKYAIPFASMVGFLHPESRQCNIYAVRSPEVAAAVAKSDVAAQTRTVLMVPGDRWSSESGFELKPNDYFERQDEWIERLAQTAAPKIAQEEADEREMTLTFDAFDRHFGSFLRSLPPFIGLLLTRRVAFHVPSDADTPYWVLDFARRVVRREAVPPNDRANIVHIREGVLADAIGKNVVAFVHISMRLRIELAHGGVQTDFLFWGLLSLRELGYFPLRNMATLRAARVLWRRRWEGWGLVQALVSFRSFDEKVMGTLMSRATAGRHEVSAAESARHDR
jgi:UDP-MurNAc hydroxylase